MYIRANKEAEEYIQSHLDSDFKLNLDSSGSHADTSSAPSKDVSLSENVPCEPSSQHYLLNGKKKPHQGSILALNNGSYVKEPGRWGAGASAQEDILHCSDKEPMKSRSRKSQRTEKKDSTPAEPIKTKRGRKRKRESSAPIIELCGSDSKNGLEENVVLSHPKKSASPPLTEPLQQSPSTPPAPVPVSALTASTPITAEFARAATPASSSTAVCSLEIDRGDEDLMVSSISDSDDDLPAVDLSIKETVDRKCKYSELNMNEMCDPLLEKRTFSRKNSY